MPDKSCEVLFWYLPNRNGLVLGVSKQNTMALSKLSLFACCSAD